MGYLLKSSRLSEPQFSHLKNGDNDGTYLKEFFCDSNEEKIKKTFFYTYCVKYVIVPGM